MVDYSVAERNYYPTPNLVSKSIYTKLSKYRFKNIIDLGVGSGNLVLPFSRGNKNRTIIGVDIDSTYKKDLIRNGVEVLKADLYSCNISRLLSGVDASLRSLIISNPPFTNLAANNSRLKVLKNNFLMPDEYMPKTIRSELVFLAKALEVANSNTVLCFILPFSFLVSDRYRYARSHLINNHCVTSIDTYPQGVFKNTEVRTAVIYIEANKRRRVDIDMFNYVDGSLKKITCDDFAAGKLHDVSSEGFATAILQDLDVSLARGVYSFNHLKDKKYSYVHTSHLREYHAKSLSGSKCYKDIESDGQRVAKKSDILLSRVGTRCIGNVAFVREGYFGISDCVIRIRVKNSLAKPLFKYLVSERAQRYFNEYASGACAKILTYQMLKEMPVRLL